MLRGIGRLRAGGGTAGPVTDTDATAWAAAVTSAGGTYSAPTLAAVTAFCVSAKAKGYWTKLARINLFCGDQLTAALVPLKVGAGSATDTNTNFVSGNYTEATGIQGANTKSLSTGLNANTLTLNDTHMAVYNRSTAATGGSNTIGSGSALALFAVFGSDGKAYSNQYTSAQLSTASALTVSPGYGLIIATRTSSTSHTIYQKGSSVATTAAAESGSPTAGAIKVFTADGTNFSNHLLAGYSIGSGLSGTDVTNFNTDMVTFQTALSRNV